MSLLGCCGPAGKPSDNLRLEKSPQNISNQRARAVKPLRDSRRELEKTIRGLTKDEEM